MVRLVYDFPWGSSSWFVKSWFSWALGYGGLCHEAQKVDHKLGRKISLYALSFIGSFERPSLCLVLPWVRLSSFQVMRNILSFIHWGFHFWVHIWVSKSYVCLLNVPFSNSMFLFHGYNAFLSFEDIIKTNFPVIVFLSLFFPCVFVLASIFRTKKCSQICGNHCSNLFIYWLHWGFIAAHGLSLVAESGV